MIDGLTGIANRRRFDETLVGEWKRAVRSGTSLALMIADIDFFKNYNDHYGHGEGDECLKRVAASLARSVDRPSDLVARYGGEEFVAILPETDLEGAKLIAERFRADVDNQQIPHRYSETAGHVTVSVGVAAVVADAAVSASDLLKLADEQLYLAKHNGRNRVC